MFCRYCGQELAEGTRLCTYCGKKTVKLRPRQTGEASAEARPSSDTGPFPAFEEAPPAREEPRQEIGFREWLERSLADWRGRIADLTAGLRSGEEAAAPVEFNLRIWTVCGVLTGLALLFLVEFFASLNRSALLFAFLRELHPVWLLAGFLNSLIIMVTLLKGYHYRHSPEYLEALRPREDAEGTDLSTPVRISTPAGEEPSQELPEPETEEDPPAGEEDRLTPEAREIIAELQKLDFDL